MGSPNERYGTVVDSYIPNGDDPKDYPAGRAWRGVIFEYDARGIGETSYRTLAYPDAVRAHEALSKECAKRGITDIRSGGHLIEPPGGGDDGL